MQGRVSCSLCPQALLEDYCQRTGFKLTRQVVPRLQPQELEQLREAMTSRLGEIDALVLELCESGRPRKCQLLEMRTDTKVSLTPSTDLPTFALQSVMTLVATQSIRKNEPIGALTGAVLRFATPKSRCTRQGFFLPRATTRRSLCPRCGSLSLAPCPSGTRDRR